MKVIALILIAALLAGCGGATTTTSVPSLSGTSWTLADIDGTPIDPYVSATIAFDDQTASGRGGCNQFNGGYAVSEGSISFTAMGWTKMACPDPAMSIETRFLGALEAGGAVTITDSTLEITAIDGTTLHFVSQ